MKPTEKKGTEVEAAWEVRKCIQVCTMPKSMGMETDTHKYREKEK